jgi:transposase
MEKPTSTRPKKGGSYPPEFRIEAVRYWLSSGKKSKDVAAELGVSDWSLNHWRQEQEGRHALINPAAESAPPQADALEMAKENGRLRRELEAMTRQRDILKKAISIFSAENLSGGLK